MVIGDGSWIGQQCFIHSAGDLIIGNNVGLGPGTKIITSFHIEEDLSKPLRYGKIVFSPVVIEDDVHIGLGTIILPGVTIAKGTQVGAGAVVTKNFPEYAVLAGVPARLLYIRGT
jgi:acetyltransferase-like isoleucine patch superfamily enzyme